MIYVCNKALIAIRTTNCLKALHHFVSQMFVVFCLFHFRIIWSKQSMIEIGVQKNESINSFQRNDKFL